MTSEDRRAFGVYFQDLRKSAGLPQVKAATLAGVSVSYLRGVERNERGVPSRRVLTKLAPAYGVSAAELYERAGWPTKEQEAARRAYVNSLDGALVDAAFEEAQSSLLWSCVLEPPRRRLTPKQEKEMKVGFVQLFEKNVGKQLLPLWKKGESRLKGGEEQR